MNGIVSNTIPSRLMGVDSGLLHNYMSVANQPETHMAREDYSIEEALFTALIGEPDHADFGEFFHPMNGVLSLWFRWRKGGQSSFEIGLSGDRWLWWHPNAKQCWIPSSLPRILKLLNDPAFRKKHGLKGSRRGRK